MAGWTHVLIITTAVALAFSPLIDYLIRRYRTRQNELDYRQQPFIWCLVGNVVAQHEYSVDKEIRYGSKHFAPGAKVYCISPDGYDGYTKIRVIGMHRSSKRRIYVIMPINLLTDLRLKKVYDPVLLDMIAGQPFRTWTYSLKDKELILALISSWKNNQIT